MHATLYYHSDICWDEGLNHVQSGWPLNKIKRTLRDRLYLHWRWNEDPMFTVQALKPCWNTTNTALFIMHLS